MRHKWQIQCWHVLKISRYELFDTYCIHTLDGELCITSSLNHNQYVSIGIRPQPFRGRKPKLCRNLWIYLTTRGGKHLISWFWHRAEPPRYLDMRNSQRDERLSSNFWGKVEDYFGRCFTQLLTASFEFYENAVLQFCCAADAPSSSRTDNWLSHCIPV